MSSAADRRTLWATRASVVACLLLSLSEPLVYRAEPLLDSSAIVFFFFLLLYVVVLWRLRRDLDLAGLRLAVALGSLALFLQWANGPNSDPLRSVVYDDGWSLLHVVLTGSGLMALVAVRRRDAAPGAPADPRMLAALVRRRPRSIAELAVAQGMTAILTVIVALSRFTTNYATGDGTAQPALLILAAFGAVLLASAVGVWRVKPYARLMALVAGWMGVCSALLFVGLASRRSVDVLWPSLGSLTSVVSLLTLLNLTKPGVKVLFSRKPIVALTAREAGALGALMRRSPGSTASPIIAVVGSVLVVLLMFFVVAPPVIIERSAGSEATAIGSLRGINSAQSTYAERCHGYAPSLPALAGFVMPPLSSSARVTHAGYVVGVEPLLGATTVANPPEGCAGSVSGYFASADPLEESSGSLTRKRFHFATDETGTVFKNGRAPIANPISLSDQTLRLQ